MGTKLGQKLFWAVGAVVTLVAFNNCGEGFVMSSISGGSTYFSTAGGETCEEAIVKVYASTFHPFLTQTCSGCHVAGGPGLGVFGATDVRTSYTAFSSVGAAKISSQAVNASHKPPYTGPVNQARITEINSYWSAAQEKYAQCLVDTGASAPSSGVKSASITVPANLATNTNFQTMTWDLATASPSVPLTATIEIRRAVVGGVTQGYEFRNPSLRLKNASSGSYQAQVISIYVNSNLASEVTTYQNVNAVISTTTATNLSAGTANALLVMTPNATDVIALQFATLKSTSATNPTPTPTPTATASPTATPATVTFTQLVASGGVFANSCVSCHAPGKASGGLDLTNYAAAKLAAANIKSRMNNANNPMPTSGILAEAQRNIVNTWVDKGAPQ
ncbi:hypothetical protein ACLVWU_07120 [Bdellovibrio sp. HCB290]|uniref:hypothetical protein n=1 Tax=Bdellovibrio sp. HCB290 TaxID=3394356 RepID=UPI0039B4A7F8